VLHGTGVYKGELIKKVTILGYSPSLLTLTHFISEIIRVRSNLFVKCSSEITLEGLERSNQKHTSKKARQYKRTYNDLQNATQITND
jgi:hypothetical protein